MKKKTLAVVVAAAGVVLALTGCSHKPSADTADIKGLNERKPDRIEVFANVNHQPNIVMLCIHQVAFATTSRTSGINAMRVEAWDHLCPGYVAPVAPAQ